MPIGGNLLDYGIAVNFFGNYRQESSALNRSTDSLNFSLRRLQNLVIGGGITAGLYKFTSSILRVATMMEQNFANLKSTLGSAAKAIETLNWAREQGARTPFGIEEVNSAVSLMTTLGFNKDKSMREEVFNSIGDFAGLRGYNFADMMQRVAKASFGNWEALGDTFGIRMGTIGGMVREQMARTPDKFTGEESSIEAAIKMVEEGKKGTQEYKMAIVELIGVLGRGGMKNRLDTIAGAWANVDDLVQNFMANMVGYSQVQGTLAEAIKNTIVEGILNPFMETHTAVINGIEETTTSVDQLGRIGKGVGDIFQGLWSMVDSQVSQSSNSIMGWIDRMDAFFRNYEENVAPIILFLAIVKLQVEDFLKSFYEGFRDTFTWFIDAGAGVWGMFAKIAKWMGLADTTADGLGKTLGWVLGIMLGMKAYRIMTAPFTPLINGASRLLSILLETAAAQRAVLVAQGVNPTIGNIFKSMIAPITGAATASWGFTASLLANPITWIVVGVAALVAWLGYLIYNWEEVGTEMQNVSDIALGLLTVLNPLIGAPLLMAKHWDLVSSNFNKFWRILESFYNTGVILFRDSIEKHILVPFNTIKNTVTSLWDSFETNYPRVASWLKQMFAPLILVWEKLEWMYEKGDFINGLFTKAGEWLGGMANWAEGVEQGVTNKYGTEEEKREYQKRMQEKNDRLYGKGTMTPGTGTPTVEEKTEVTVPNVTIYMQPGEDPKDVANTLASEIKNAMGKEGK